MAPAKSGRVKNTEQKQVTGHLLVSKQDTLKVIRMLIFDYLALTAACRNNSETLPIIWMFNEIYHFVLLHLE